MRHPFAARPNRSLWACLAACLLATPGHAAEFHVAPTGDDRHAGTAAQPFATLERARDAARADGEDSTILLADGVFRLSRTLALDARDSRTLFKAAPGAKPCLVGSQAVPPAAVRPVADPTVRARFAPQVRDQVREIDLAALGIRDFGELGPRGFRRPYIPAPLELFVDGQPLSVARWPNPGHPGIRLGKVLDPGSVTRNGDRPTRGGTFALTTDRPRHWAPSEDIWITGFFGNGYADSTVRVEAIDLKKNTLTTAQPHMYGFSSGSWVALNVMEEVDLPGEYATDRRAGKLYFLPPQGVDLAHASLEVSVMDQPLLAIEGATGVVFDGVDFKNARGMGVYIERGADDRIQNATLCNLGMVAVCIGKGVTPDPDYRHGFTGQPMSRGLGSWHEHIYDNPAFNREAGTGHGVVNCRIFNIGEGAVSLGGGDRQTLTPGGNFVENCDIHDFNRWDRTYRGGVNIDGVGNRVSHCHIHRCPAVALYLHGNEHVLEYNEIDDAMTQGDDMGVFYMGRDPTERGNIIRYNYIHDSALRHFTVALYFDDSGGDGSKVYGNVFKNVGHGCTVFIPGGSDFTVVHNLFVDCRRPIWVRGYRSGRKDLFKARIDALRATQPPWSTRYPELVDYFTGKHPRNNRIGDNLTLNHDDPRLADPANGDFGLKPGADTGIPGFEPIPFDRIGLKRQ